MGFRAGLDVPIQEQNVINISTYKKLKFVQQNLQEQPICSNYIHSSYNPRSNSVKYYILLALVVALGSLCIDGD